jgi:hypothetical protein
MRAELIGRCANSLGLLPRAERPSNWTKVVQGALDKLAAKKRGLAPFFPGPMDDFLAQKDDAAAHPELTKIEVKLKKAKNLAKGRGLTGLAYLGRPSKASAEHVRRLLEQSARTMAADAVSNGLLEVCAHIAVCARSELLANTVMDLCLRNVGNGEAKNDIDMFLIMTEACGAFIDRSAYHDALGRAATRLSYALPLERDMIPFRSILETLGQRDPKLISPLGRAAALVEAVELSR